MQKVMQLLPVLDALARQRFPQTALAEEATSYALEKWAAENWKRVHAYRGEGSFRAYFERVSLNLLNDFARMRFGRPRPPVHVRALGALAVRLYTLLCLEGYTPEDASAIATQEVPGGRQPELLRYYIQIILSSVHDCGVQYSEQSLEEEAALDYAADRSASEYPEVKLCAAEESAVLEALRQWCSFTGGTYDDINMEMLQKIRCTLQSTLHLGDEERLLLQFVYQDAMSVSEAGRLLGFNAAQTHGRLRRLLQRIRDTLDAAMPC